MHISKTLCLIFAIPAMLTTGIHSASLAASDGVAGDYFGFSPSLSGSTGLVGAYGANGGRGSAYVFRDLDTATDTITQNAKLTAADGMDSDLFGTSTSLADSVGLVGANGADSFRGAAYVFRNLDTATGTVTQNAKLTASDGAASDGFGYSTSASGGFGLPGGTIGLVGAYGDDTYRGSAYVFRSLHAASGTVTQNAKLTASDGATFHYFGESVSSANTIGLVGASGNASSRGAAYVFHGLDTVLGTVTQNAKFTASDGVAGDRFGYSTSLADGYGLIGAPGVSSSRGAAYLFRGMLGVVEDREEDTRLSASDGAASDFFGQSVSVSGTNGLVGAPDDDDKGSSSGSVYLFRGLNTAGGTISESIKLTASDGAASDMFGVSVHLAGDHFLIGATGKNAGKGKTYRGSPSSMTTLDSGPVGKSITDIDFISRADWIIGQATDGNSVALEAAGMANVTASGKKVYIGKNAGSDNNTLYIDGTLTATEVHVGGVGNTGNALILEAAGIISPGCHVFVAPGSSIGGNGLLQGNLTLAAGARLELETNLGLDVQGTVALDPTFGADDVSGLDGTTATNTYLLISNSTTNFSTLGLQHFGSVNAYSIGGGKAAYLSSPVAGTLLLTVQAVSIPVITSAATASGTAGSPLTYQITASNGPTSFSALSLPAGLTVHATTGMITGTPTTAGTFVSSVRATNAGGTGIKAVTFTILTPAPVITSASVLSGTVGTSLTYQITASNNPTSFSASNLPAGLTVHTATGMITGTPTTAGTFVSSVRATNAGGTGIKAVTFTILTPAPVITSASVLSGTVGTSLSYQITGSNTPTSFSASNLPSGFTINLTTGRITGVPKLAGVFNATVKATNAGGTGSKVVTVTIAKETQAPVLSITTPVTANVTTKETSYTVKGKATDNISPVKVEYRIDPPGSKGYGAYKSIPLRGTEKSKNWAYKLTKITTGEWKIQFRVLDAAGNTSKTKIVKIIKK